MSYVGLRSETGIYEYRRVIPPRLRSVIASVEGFDNKPGRTEFTKSLDTRAKAEANRRGAIVDLKLQAALDRAASRLATPSARPSRRGSVERWQEAGAPSPLSRLARDRVKKFLTVIAE
jgi:hypothetical protein